MAPVQRFLAVLAALMGACGVALAAAAAHVDGGEFARTASLFLILHAAALIAVSAHRAGSVAVGRRPRAGGGRDPLLPPISRRAPSSARGSSLTPRRSAAR